MNPRYLLRAVVLVFAFNLALCGIIAAKNSSIMVNAADKTFNINEKEGGLKLNCAFIGDNPTQSLIKAYEEKTGVKLESVLFFHAAKKSFLFPEYTCRLLDKQNIIPFIKFEPWSWKGKNDQSFSLQAIDDGDFDGQFAAFAKGAASYEKPVIFSFAHEMNASGSWAWYPWQGDPEAYKKAYIRIHKIFTKHGARNVRWAWVINANSAPPEDYYPGDKFVDYIGIDGYSADWNGNTDKPDAIFEREYQMLRAAHPAKPILISETGYDENHGGSYAFKQEYIRNLVTYCSSRQIPFYYFDIDKHEAGSDRVWSLKKGDLYAFLGECLKNIGSASWISKKEDSSRLSIVAQGSPGILVHLKDLMSLYGAFNGATAKIEDLKSNPTIKIMASECTDPGLAINLVEPMAGSISFNNEGSVSSGYRDSRFTVLFIKSTYSGDEIISEADIDSRAGGEQSLEIPGGTDKINFMLVGPGSSCDLTVSNIKLYK